MKLWLDTLPSGAILRSGHCMGGGGGRGEVLKIFTWQNTMIRPARICAYINSKDCPDKKEIFIGQKWHPRPTPSPYRPTPLPAIAWLAITERNTSHSIYHYLHVYSSVYKGYLILYCTATLPPPPRGEGLGERACMIVGVYTASHGYRPTSGR